MPDQINANYNPLNLDKINDEYEFKFDNANMGVAPPPLVGQEKVAKPHYYGNMGVVANVPIVADNIVQMFNAAPAPNAVPDWWPKGVVGHDVPGEEEEYIDDGDDDELVDDGDDENGDEVVANKEIPDFKPYPGILPKAFGNAIIDNMAPQKENYKKVNLPKPQKPAQYINNAEQAIPHPCNPCDAYYPLKETNLKGMMVFYVNTNGMPAEQAMMLLEKVSNQYEDISNKLKKNGVEIMWLPTNTGNTTANYFNFQ